MVSKQTVKSFYDDVERTGETTDNELISFFGFYLQRVRGQISFSSRQIDLCFAECDLAPPNSTAVYLSKMSKKGPGVKFIKVNPGYKLERTNYEALTKRLGQSTPTVQTSKILGELSAKMHSGFEKDFLNETIRCFEVGATRATITMMWLLTVNHLYKYIFQKELSAFNGALTRQTDKKLQAMKVTDLEEFGEIGEKKFIELARSAGVISNDVRKMLDDKLGTRNSAAHPSAMKFSPRKAEEYIEDLIDNVILKYAL